MQGKHRTIPTYASTELYLNAVWFKPLGLKIYFTFAGLSVLGGTLEILTPTVDLTLAPLDHVLTTQFVRIQGMPQCANVPLNTQEIPT